MSEQHSSSDASDQHGSSWLSGTGQVMATRVNGDPASAGLERWLDSVGNVTLPLLAGFSTASAVVVSGDAEHFQWPGATILALVFAAVALIVAVQCSYHAHIYLSECSDRKDSKGSPVPPSEESRIDTTQTSQLQDPDYLRAIVLARRTRLAYDLGLVALFLGLALVVIPHHATNVQAGFQWPASCLALAACFGEMVWILRDPLVRPSLGGINVLTAAFRRFRRGTFQG